MSRPSWPEPTDDAEVERLIATIQRTVASAHDERVSVMKVSAPDLANALLVVLASVLEESPDAATPAGLRQLAEAAGRELRNYMRDARRLRDGDGTA